MSASSNAPRCSLIVTTIQAPNQVLTELSEGAERHAMDFVVIGDARSPTDFHLPGCDYYCLDRQHASFGAFSQALPIGHYARKNLGYLAALQRGSDWLVETDDDNYPLDDFFEPPAPILTTRQVSSASNWINAYTHFSPDHPIWPRGFPLDALSDSPAVETGSRETPPAIVQGLADENPDVDAVFRLTRPLPVYFDPDGLPLSLSAGQWCPFNSQNTWIHRDFAALAYLPSHCSFRMTDIWRSFVAQRCLWAAQRELIFIAPTVRQERNAHDLMKDFADEVPGYLHNRAIADTLEACTLRGNPADDLRDCYAALVDKHHLPGEELLLVDAWLAALESA